METVHSTQTLSMQVTNHDWISWSRIEKIHTPEDSLHTGLSRQRELKQDRYVQSFTTYPWSNVQDVCIMQFVYFNPQNQMNKCMLSEDFLATHKHKRPPPPNFCKILSNKTEVKGYVNVKLRVLRVLTVIWTMLCTVYMLMTNKNSINFLKFCLVLNHYANRTYYMKNFEIAY